MFKKLFAKVGLGSAKTLKNVGTADIISFTENELIIEAKVSRETSINGSMTVVSLEARMECSRSFS